LDEEVERWDIQVLKSPVRMPTANAHCERLVGISAHELSIELLRSTRSSAPV
jgi:hypothetical protein